MSDAFCFDACLKTRIFTANIELINDFATKLLKLLYIFKSQYILKKST